MGFNLMTRLDLENLVEYLHSTRLIFTALSYSAYADFSKFGPTLRGFNQDNNIP